MYYSFLLPADKQPRTDWAPPCGTSADWVNTKSFGALWANSFVSSDISTMNFIHKYADANTLPLGY